MASDTQVTKHKQKHKAQNTSDCIQLRLAEHWLKKEESLCIPSDTCLSHFPRLLDRLL